MKNTGKDLVSSKESPRDHHVRTLPTFTILRTVYKNKKKYSRPFGMIGNSIKPEAEGLRPGIYSLSMLST